MKDPRFHWFGAYPWGFTIDAEDGRILDAMELYQDNTGERYHLVNGVRKSVQVVHPDEFPPYVPIPDA